MKSFYIALLLCVAGSALAQPKKIFDFKSFPSISTYSGLPAHAIEFNGKLFFDDMNGATGTELYVSDGTTDGTHIVKDIAVSSNHSYPRNFIVMNDRLYFTATEIITTPDASAVNIWKTDGTETGTVRIANTPTISMDYDVVVLNNTLYFPGTTKDTGIELWKITSDGVAGIVKDIIPGATGSAGSTSIYAIGAASNYIYFNADDGVHGKELWRSDGTADGTVFVKDINANGSSIADNTQFAAVGNIIYFAADDGVNGIQLWRSDGSESGTFAVTDFDGNVANDVTLLADKIFFHADTGSDVGVYTSQGAPGDAILIQGDPIGSVTSVLDKVKGFFEYNDELYFLSPILQLWKSDGTPGGAILVGSFENSALPNRPIQTAAVDDRLWLSLRRNAVDELYQIDESGLGYITSGSFDIYKAGDQLIAFKGSTSIGYEPHLLDPGTSQMTLIKDINQEISDAPASFKSAGKKVFFTANDGEHGRELWVTDGTTEGTKMVADIRPGPNSGASLNVSIFRDKAIFQVYGNNSHEVWMSDGTENGTYRVKGFDGPNYIQLLSPTFPTYRDNTYFFSNDGKLWRTDGRIEETVLVKDFATTGFFGFPKMVVDQLGSKMFLTFRQEELWVSDGTDAGTVKIKDLDEEAPGQFQLNVIMAGKNKVYINDLNSSFNAQRLWVSDGTTEGTRIVKSVSESNFVVMQLLSVIDDIAYFMIQTDLNGYTNTLWRTDGTDAGTYELHGPLERLGGSVAFNTGSTVLLDAGDNINGFELWKTDGTNEGTKFVKEFNPGWPTGNPYFYYKHLDNIYFTAYTPERGYELWKTDPTATNIYPVSEISPGVANNRIREIASAGNNLVFLARNGEIWSLDPTQQLTFNAIADRDFGTGPITLSATATSGLPVEFISLFDNASISGNTLTVIHGGPVRILATQPGNGDVDAVSAERTFTVRPIGQTITFDAISEKISNDAPFTLTATASSGLPVKFEVVSGPATISGNTLTITGVGDVTVKATQTGSSDYGPVFSEQTFTVKLFVGLEDEASGVGVYPNPATNSIVVHTPSTFRSISLKDIMGRNMINMEIDKEYNIIDVERLPRGMYFILLTGNDNRPTTIKVVLK